MKNFDSSWDEWRNSTLYLPDSDDELAKVVRRAKDLGLSARELAIFQAIWYDYGQVPSKEILAHNAFGSLEQSKVTRAIERCFDDGFIQFVTADFLLEMKAELDAGGYLVTNSLIGSFEENVGLISFTRAGVDLYQKWIEFVPAQAEYWACGLQISSPFEIYGTSEELCISALPSDPVEFILEAPAGPIGRWCDRWWNRFERGYRLTYTVTNETDY